MKQAWHAQDVIAEVRKRGSSLMQLGRENGFAINTFYMALHNRFPRVHGIIADYLGVQRRDIWPHWYGPDDRPLGRTRQVLRAPGKRKVSMPVVPPERSAHAPRHSMKMKGHGA